MTSLAYLVRRNTRLFFKDKGMFFTSLITPLILIVLFVTFLKNVYTSSIMSSLPENFLIPEKLIDGFVGGFLFSSLLAVSSVTVSFCANLLMVQDKVTGARHDLTISPVKPWILSISYYISTAFTAIIISFTALAVCLAYLAATGWYLSARDILLTAADVLLIALFGTALSSVICRFLSTQGQISAVTAIISSVYGFICGAYMPMAQFSAGLRNVLSLLPGTYGTSLLHNHLTDGVFREMQRIGCPQSFITDLRDNFDCNIYLFDKHIDIKTMYIVLGGCVALLIAVFIIAGSIKKKPSGNS